VVEVLSDNARIPLKQLMGRMVTVELVRGDGSLRYFNGYVFDFKFVKTDGGYAFYMVSPVGSKTPVSYKVTGIWVKE
jgi:type VI secretion system secreted protein VgrG